MITYIIGEIENYINAKVERIEKIGPNPFLWCYTDTLVLTTLMFFNQIGGPPDPDFHTYQRSFKWFIYFGKALAMIMSLILSFTVTTLVYPLDLINYLYYRKIYIHNLKGPENLKGLFDDYYFKPKELVIRDGEIKSLCDSNGYTVLPKGLKQLYINNTRVRTLKGIPEGVEYLNLNNNKINDLSYLPRSVKTFYLGSNPCIDQVRYSNIFKPYPYVNVEKLHNYNRSLDFEKGIVLIKKIFKNHYAKQIQKVWKNYWYNPYYDSNYGYYVSRFMISKQKILC